MTQLSTDDKKRLTSAIAERGDVRAHLALQWVRNLDRIARELVVGGAGTSVDTQAAFWIRLHAVLVELGEHYEYLGNLIGPQPANLTSRHALLVRDAISTVRDALDEDERIYLHYRRDTQCHIWQESYELGVKGGKLKEQRRFSLIGQTLHVDEFDRRVRAFLRKHHVDETAITVVFAKRLAPLINFLLVAMVPLYTT